MTLQPEELTELNFMIDAVTARPELYRDILDRAPPPAPVVKKALQILTSALETQPADAEGMKRAAKTLVERGDELGKIVGWTIMKSMEARSSPRRRTA